MAYATAAQVQNEFKSIDFASSGLVTTAKVEQWIEETEAEINARISGKYTVPVTATTAVLLLRRICIGMVKCRIDEILAVKAPIDPNKQAAFTPTCEARFEKLMDKIASGKIPLPGADLGTPGGGWDSEVADDDDVNFEFDVMEPNW